MECVGGTQDIRYDSQSSNVILPSEQEHNVGVIVVM